MIAMRIRTQLVAAFLLLAVVPLTSIVLFSYFTSIRALERAVEAEANERTAEMDQRMKGIRQQFDRGFSGLSQLPFGPVPEGRSMKRLLTEIGDVAPLVRGLVVVPRPPLPEEGTPELPEPGDAPEPPEPAPAPDLVVPPFRIDISGLEKALEEALLEESAETDEAAEEAAAEVGRASAEMAMIGLAKAAEALRRLGDEEAQRKIEEELAREIGLRAEKLAEHFGTTARHAVVEAVKAEERRAAEDQRRQAESLLGRKLGFEIHDRGAVVAEVRAEVNPEEVLHRVLEAKRRAPGELPFLLDGEGRLHSLERDERVLESLELEHDPATGRARPRRHRDNWMVVSTVDPDSGVVFGVARPIGASLAEIRQTTARNLGIGLALVGLALLGVLPLSRRITRGLEAVTESAERIARGDLSTRVPVASENEVGQLASAFNRMAEDLATQQRRLVEEEGRRKEQELDLERKSRELEDARQFQLSLLPKSVPRHPSLEVAVDMRTAAEVGGDYYDFHLAADGTLTLAIGDATGHGARAGTMVTVVKSLFSSAAADQPLADFLRQASRTIKRMDLGRMAMALTVARFHGDRLTLSAAGMPPALVWRAGSGEVEELALAGMPLGSLASDYEERSTELAADDTLLLLSDGLPEQPNADGEPFGYPAVRQAFAAAAAQTPDEIIRALTATAAGWSGGGPPSDDVTFLVVKKKSWTPVE
jgi:serine phosphatase RsbU (regulator of sigma subunit)